MERRAFLIQTGRAVACMAAPASRITMDGQPSPRARSDIVLFLGGDVMTGRGIDQILEHPSRPELYEPYVKDAGHYVTLAEAVNDPIPRAVSASYIWGDLLPELDLRGADARIVNLETAVTRSDEYWPGKEIHYRMHPGNAACLTAAHIDCCSLANNHVLDWGYPGLIETLDTLRQAGVQTAGAGGDRADAEAAAVVAVPGKGRVLVFGVGLITSGIPPDWGAGEQRPGVNVVTRLSDVTITRIAAVVRAAKRPGDLVVLSIHWGGNWGYRIPPDHRRFAHRLIDEADVDVVHGHSSHHPLAIEVHRGRPIFYGCGDLLNDYEGIGGYEEFRSHVVLGYFARMNPGTGALVSLVMTPFEIKRFRLGRSAREDADWLRDTLSREGRALGTTVGMSAEGALVLRW